MANVINKAINKFGKGLVMDFSPENTGNEVLTNALNATLLTFNGNELSLQNDMGNARVETAFLPEGYIPVGTCEYGGIIYIVSYNPLEDKSQIGCFPSPERNISSDEIGTLNQTITYKDFQEENENGNVNGNIKHLSKYVLLKEDNLNPGDKFIIQTGENIYEEKLQDLYIDDKLVENPILKISVVSIEDSGKITYLDSTLRQYEKTTHLGDCKYHILGSDKTDNNEMTKPDIDAYRNVLSSGYNVFKSKTSGKLALLAELITIDSYSVTHSIVPKDDSKTEFDIIIHTEVSPMPESKSFFVEDSEEGTPVTPPSGSESRSTIIIKDNNYYQIPKLKYYYLEESQGNLNYNAQEIKFYTDDGKYNSAFYNTKLNEIYTIEDSDKESVLDLDKTIKDNGAIIDIPMKNTYHGNNDSYLISYDSLQYNNVKLGSVKIPQTVLGLRQPFPFTYEYTLVPCMEYGKLNDLKISNKIDFSKIRDFSQSKFNAWRYRIDGNQLKLTFGAEVYDLDSDKIVIGLHLDFYDQHDFVGSLSINDENRSYSGEFTRILSLDTPNVLNNVQIINNHPETIDKKTFIRNVNIINNGNGTYSYLGRPCKKIGNSWNYEYGITIKPPTENQTRGGSTSTESYNESRTIESDGFMLQSNLIYGVKAYFKIKDKSGNIYYEYNRPFALFTFPIYNDKYYSKKDFSVLQPDLKLALTYTLNDESERYIYDDGNIIEGYSNNDKSKIDTYLNGTYNETNLSATKYYNYKGTTKLKLQCGLKKEYENIGFWIDPEDLNNKCQFNLRLMGNTEDNNFYYESDISDLNYGSNTITNSLTFKDGKTSLINQSLDDEFEIKYNFITGYKFDISDIRTTEIPTTTFCALCHIKDGVYNYEDFGIYYNEEEKAYFNTAAIYNSGNSKKSNFGLCKQVKLWYNDGSIYKMDTYFNKVNTVSTEDIIVEKGKLNVNLFSNIKDYIGKLTFCQPHIHQIDSNYGVNIYRNSNNKYAISKYIDTYKNDDNQTESSKGLMPSSWIYDYPCINLSLNTLSLINYQTEFISTTYFNQFDGNTTFDVNVCFTDSGDSDNWTTGTNNQGYLREFVGLGPGDLALFNKCLITTMKNIYAYNPDYDTLKIKVGDVKLQEYNTKFISNISSSNFRLTDESKFNNYIKFGPNSNEPFIMSDYINNLKNYLDLDKVSDYKEILNTSLTFIPDYTYCGKSDPSYLIVTLNYNIPSPKTLVDELSFKGSNIILKHENGDIEFFDSNKIPNKKILYGYDKNSKKLIQLDVKNYEIKSGGVLELTKSEIKDKITYVNPTTDYYEIIQNAKYDIKSEYQNKCFRGTSITINDLIYDPYSDHRLFIKNNCWYPTKYSDNNLVSESIIYYRQMGNVVDVNKDHKDWSWEYNTYNRLYLYSGPCFVKYDNKNWN